MSINHPFKHSVSDLREMVHFRRMYRNAVGAFVVASVTIGVPFVVFSWIWGAVMCNGGHGPDISYCM